MHIRRSITRGAAPLLAALTLVAGCDGEMVLNPLQMSAEVSPTTLDLGTVWGGSTVTRTLRVTNTGSGNLRITTATIEDADGPGFVSVTPADVALNPGDQTEVEVRLTAMPMANGLVVATVRLELLDVESFAVPLVASVRPEPPCEDDNPCTIDSFDGTACRNELAPDGSFCDDGNACTTNTVCAAGACLGQPLTCEDDVECTIDACDPAVGCVFEPNPARCDDDDGCTTDTCVLGAGCVNTPSPPGTICYYDGCTEIGVCTGGTCVIAPTPDGLPCEDGDGCTEGDFCQAGECVSGVPSEIGATPPVVVAEGYFQTELCLPDYDCSGVAQSTVQEILDVRQDIGGGTTYALWRGEYFHTTTGEPCTPSFLEPVVTLNPGPAPVPEPPPPPDDNAGAPDEAPALLPETETCAAGIFYTRVPSGAGLPTTVQLTTTRGAAAGAVHPSLPLGLEMPIGNGDTGRLIVATLNETSDRLRVQLFNDMGAEERREETYNITAWPSVLVRQLRVSRWQHDMLIVAQPRERVPSIDCDDDVDCDGVGCCTSSMLTALTYDVANVGGMLVGQHFLPINDAPLNGCLLGQVEGPQPWYTFDLHASVSPLDSQLEVSLRTRTDWCMDRYFPDGTGDAGAEVFRFTAPSTATAWQSAEPLVLSPAFGLNDVQHMRHEAASGRAAAVVALDCEPEAEPDPPPDVDGGVADGGLGDGECDPPLCGTPAGSCTERWAGYLDIGGDAASLQDRLLGPLVATDAQAYPLLVELKPKLLVRAGSQLRLLHRDEEGDIQSLQPPALADDFLWDHTVQMQGIEGVIGGVARKTLLTDCCPDDDPTCDQDCDGDGLIEAEVTRLVIQGFECGAMAGPEVGCTEELDCQSGQTCTGRAELCLPVEEPCDPADPSCTPLDNCGGRCVDVDFSCFPVLDPCVPDGDVPLCPDGAAAAQVDCAWACIDPVTCTLLVDDPEPDAGVEDGGAAVDAGPGAVDGGVSDAGQSLPGDGGPLDAGPDAG
jgi:hypothetical protein